MTTINTDADTILSDPEPLTLSNGIEVVVNRLQFREMLSLMKIFTRGVGAALMDMNFDRDDEDAFTGQLLGALLMSVPEAEDETIEFLSRMVNPSGLRTGKLTEKDVEFNADLYVKVREVMWNPEGDDVLEILDRIVTNEAPHMLALGKRLMTLLEVHKKSLTAKNKAATKKRNASSGSASTT